MSTRVEALSPRPALRAAVPAAIVVGALGLLLGRVVAPARLLSPSALTVVYGSLLAMSLAGSPGRVERRVAPSAAAAAGAVAIVAARVLAGPAVGMRATPALLIVGSLAALAEEAFFRRFLFARLEAAGTATAVAASAFLFAIIHVPAYGWDAFPVDVAAGLLFSWQRWASGSWGAPASSHVLANLLAVIR